VLPIISEEAASTGVLSLLQEDNSLVVWWGTWAECAVAISRLRREGRLNQIDEATARALLSLLTGVWTEIEPTDDVRLSAALLSRDHPLKTADALQLAAALRWCDGNTSGAEFVCLDGRLRRAARDEGFRVLPVEEER
jgi:predicted nucleic acid-binding protein